jgi:acyl-CoA thioester hydrolase
MFTSNTAAIPMHIPAPFLSASHQVEDQWTDYNGHFNMAYYNVLFDRAAEELFEALGLGPDYVAQTNCSFFTLEAHITYLRELHAGDHVRIECQFLDVDNKRVHYVQRMLHEAERWQSCILEVMVSHVDLTAKKTSPFPLLVEENMRAVLATHKTLPTPPQVGHVIGIPRKLAVPSGL